MKKMTAMPGRSALLASMLVVVTATLSRADLTMTPTPLSPPQSDVPGFQVTDMLASFNGQFVNQQMLLTLSAGTIYQHQYGQNTPTSSALLSLFPAVQYDTFVAAGGLLDVTTELVGIPEGAEYFGQPALKFDSAGLSVSWTTPTELFDRSNFVMARLTLSDDAMGTLKYVGSTLVNGTLERNVFEWPIVGGSVGGLDVEAPVISPLALTNDTLNGVVSDVVALAPTSDPAYTWSPTLTFLGYTPAHGGQGQTGVTQPAIAPTWNPVTRAFSWDTAGSLRGDYVWEVTASNTGGPGLGQITVAQRAVPEPATLALVGLVAVGCVSIARRRS